MVKKLLVQEYVDLSNFIILQNVILVIEMNEIDYLYAGKPTLLKA